MKRSIKHYAMAMHREMDIYTILALALDKGKWSASRPGRFTPMERVNGTQRMAPRAGLDTVKSKVIPRLN
jgi:hypothetical protein